MEQHLISRLALVGNDRSALAELVVAGRAVAPTDAGPVPLPPKLGADVASTIAEMRDEERW